MKLIFRYFITIVSIIEISSSFAQSSTDDITNYYSEKLLGTWVRQNEVIDGRGTLPDTTVFSYDTLKFSIKNNYYNCQGANAERKWLGVIDTGMWNLNQKSSLKDTVVNINFHQKYSNLPLPLTSYTYIIIKLTETELIFFYYDRSFVYRKIE